MVDNATLRDEHKKFPDQMGIRTVIERALKLFLNSSDDAGLYEETNLQETEHTEVVTESEAHTVNKDNLENITLHIEDDVKVNDNKIIKPKEANNLIKKSF